MKKLLLGALLLSLTSTAHALQSVFNPFTGKLDYVQAASTQPVQGVQLTSFTATAPIGYSSATGTGVFTFIPTITSSVTLSGGVLVSSGFVYTSTVITGTTTITSSMTVVYASCTTRGAAPNAWITAQMSPAQQIGEIHRFYNVGADSCSIRIAGNGTDTIQSTGVIRLDAQTQHAYLESLGGGLWGGDVQSTPYTISTTQDDVGTFAVATSSLVTLCPIYIPVPIGITGFRISRPTSSGTNGAAVAIFDLNRRYIMGLSSMTLTSGVVNYMTGGVAQIPPGWAYMLVTLNNTTTAIAGSNSVTSLKTYCGAVGTSTSGMDLSTFAPSATTLNSTTYPAIDLVINGGLQGLQ